MDDLRKAKKYLSERNGAILNNLLLSEFNDGGQLFTSKVFDFWPLYIGILNLPANLRDSFLFLLDTATKAKEDGERLN